MYKRFIQTLIYSTMGLCLLTTFVRGMETTPSPDVAHSQSGSDIDKCKKGCTVAARTRNEKITHDLYKGPNPREAKFYEKAAGRIERAWFYCEKKCEETVLSGGFPEDMAQTQAEDYYLPDSLKEKTKPKFEAKAPFKPKFVPQPRAKVTIGSGQVHNG
jgi:hypothetical protein